MPPTEGIFALAPPPRMEFQGVFVRPPPPHPLEFPTWFGNPWKDYTRQKCCCTILLCER